jgi:hypothetical protein
MGRSGTSLTARILNLLGVDLGRDEGLIAPNARNPSGYWERHSIYEINEDVLATMGGDYANPPLLRPGWERSTELDALRRRAHDVVEDTFGASRLWGFKDPRFTMTLPFWLTIVPAMRYVICVRSPEAVCASLERFYSDTGQPGATDWPAHWFRSTAEALINTHGGTRSLVYYDDYFDDLQREIDALAAFIDRPVTEQARLAAADLVQSDLRHQLPSPARRGGHRAGPVETRLLYKALMDAHPHPRSEELDLVERRARVLLAAYTKRSRLAKSFRTRRPKGEAVAPHSVRRFPQDLFAPALDFSGIERDGWLRDSAHLVLAGGHAAQLVVYARVPKVAGQCLSVSVNGEKLSSFSVRPGLLHVRVPLPATTGDRRIELAWSASVKLSAPDERHVAALLRFIRIIPSPIVRSRRGSNIPNKLLGEALEDELTAVEELARERDLFSDTAAERLRKIDELAHEVNDRMQQTNEVHRLLERERDLHALAIAALTREKNLQAQAAEERLAIIEELRRTADPASPPRSGNR